jgi:uncharacterized membrane protein YagU involved in acid resistance
VPATEAERKSVMGNLRRAPTAAGGAAAGIAAAWVKARSEPPLQRLAERFWPPAPELKEMVGVDPSGHPENSPPGALVDALTRAFLGRAATEEERVRGLLVIHYALGASLGALYAVAARRRPAVTRGTGSVAGAALYVLTHGMTLPALRLQDPPWYLPTSAVAWEFTSHVEFGVVLEALRRLLDGFRNTAAATTDQERKGLQTVSAMIT